MPARPTVLDPSTPESLLVTLSDLHSIHAILPPSPIPAFSAIYARFRLLGPVRLFRGLLIIWTAWIVLGRLIGFRSMLAFAGSVFLLLPSPPLAHLVDLLTLSLIIRRTLVLAFLFTFGSPPDQSYPISLTFSPLDWAKSKWAVSRRPSLAFSFKPKHDTTALHGSAIEDDELEDKAGDPIYFRFEVHENQRWWMGLDWTSALLPQERPSWCDLHLLPASPPQSFALPLAASIVLPAPTRADPRGRVQRTASWRWLDDDWSIVRAGVSAAQPQMPASPTEPDVEAFSLGHAANRSKSMSVSSTTGTSPPSAHTHALEDTAASGARAPSIAEQAFTKGLERLKARTVSPAGAQAKPTAGSPSKPSSEFKRGRTGSQASEDLRESDLLPTAPLETIAEKDDVSDSPSAYV